MQEGKLKRQEMGSWDSVYTISRSIFEQHNF